MAWSAECNRCGQQIMQYPFDCEVGWNHIGSPEKPTDWALVDAHGCQDKAQPAKEFRDAMRKS